MRYFKIIFALARYCLIRLFEFRSELIGWSVANLVQGLLIIYIVDLIFGQVHAVAGWTRDEALLVAIVQGMMISLLWFFVFPSLTFYSRLIRKGELDFFLTKPINPRFLLSFSRFEFDNYIRFGVLAMIFISVVKSTVLLAVDRVAGFIFLTLLGLVIFYNLLFFIATFSFWLVRQFNILDVMDSILDVGRYPTEVFKGLSKILFFYVIPVAYIATFPVKALLGKATVSDYVIGIFLALALFGISQWFWNFALKRYSSASS
jgi:ABC-2 type transport system permease protein